MTTEELVHDFCRKQGYNPKTNNEWRRLYAMAEHIKDHLTPQWTLITEDPKTWPEISKPVLFKLPNYNPMIGWFVRENLIEWLSGSNSNANGAFWIHIPTPPTHH